MTAFPVAKVVVLGSINMDLVAHVPRIPRPGETLTGRSLSYVPGGKGANQAVAAARLGAHVQMLGRLGDDPFAATLRHGLQAAGVNTQQVLVTPDTASGLAWIGVADDGQNSITVIPGANGSVTPNDVSLWEPQIAAGEVLLMQLEVPPSTVAAAIAVARQHGVRVVLDAAPSPTEPLPAACWQVDLLSPNQTEAEQLLGRPVNSLMEAQAAAQQLLERGPQHVVIKLGELGAWLASREGLSQHIPPCPVSPVDTTAAGDAFTAAMSVEWALGQSLTDACRWACAAGALATLTSGAQPSMPTREQVVELIAWTTTKS
ncbi:ribokinase [bacterium]|nr:ribokinase [bacterium]